MSPARRPWRSQYQNWKVSRQVERLPTLVRDMQLPADLTVPKLNNVSGSLIFCISCPAKEDRRLNFAALQQ
ncbi:hypothetical protein MCOR34_000225 [Pyricularia oryzae]|nr:hypothetical protein MCOR34_000225 [Pyricularia oryzae]